MRNLIICSLLCICSSSYAFTVYSFIPWKTQLEKENKVYIYKNTTNQVNKLIKTNNIKVIYHKDIFTNGIVDPNKIKRIALETKQDPSTPISFDIELGRSAPKEKVLSIVNEVLDLYHSFKGKAPVGVYALLPQNTYGGKKLDEKQKEKYILLNQEYETLAKKVDFLSPVFYFYDGKDMDLWKKAVDFNMMEAQKYAKKYQLKIYPYIANSFKLSTKKPIKIVQLDNKQMLSMLDYLNSKGADGAIIWASSETVEDDGNKPTLGLSENSWEHGIFQFMQNR